MTAASVGEPTAPSSRKLWILSPLLDGPLIIGTPLLVVAGFSLALQWLPPLTVASFVVLTFATAHHLPGFLRIAGDPVLFERYRLRILLIPPLLFACVWWLTWERLTTVLLVSLIWAVWHGLMQVYGVMRIYAAKAGEQSALTPKLDRAMCMLGFTTILLSGGLVRDRVVAAANGTGIFGTSVLLGETVFGLCLWAFAGLSVVYVAHHVHRYATGRPVSFLKLVSLVVSLGFVYACWGAASIHPLLGLAAFEAFHDVQYIALAWGYNERLVANGSGNRMLNMLFRPKAGLVVLYLLIVGAYGLISFGTMGLARSGWHDHWMVSILAAFVATSGLLHFYTDGFIWKVRQTKTQQDLGILPLTAREETGFPIFSRSREGLQPVFVLLPLLLLGTLAIQRDSVELPMRHWLAQTFPGSAQLQLELGSVYQRHDRVEEAAEAYRAALRADPGSALAHHGVGSMYARQRRSEDAIHELDLAIEKDPTRYDSALLLGNLLIQARRLDAAEQVLRGALEQAPENPGVNEALARTLLMEDSDAAGVAEAAHLALAASRATNFEHASAIVTLAQALAAQQRYDRAIALLNKARGTPEIQTNPKLQRRILRLIRQYQKPAGAGASEG